MFARLGPWCHDRRRLVLGVWIGMLVLVRSGRRSGRLCEPRRVQPSERRVPQGLRHPRGRVRRSGCRPDRHDRLPRRAGGRGSRGPSRDGGVLRRGRPDPRCRARREPLRGGRPSADRVSKVPKPGRSRSPTSSFPTTSRSRAPPRSATRSRSSRLRSTACRSSSAVRSSQSSRRLRPKCSVSRSPSSS